MGDKVSEKSVDGLIFEIPAAEFATRLKTRSDYHAARAEKKEKEDLPQLIKLLESIESGAKAGGGKFSNYSHNPKDNVDNLKDDIRTHRSKAARLKFLSEHVINGKTYYLSLNDVDQLEITYA